MPNQSSLKTKINSKGTHRTVQLYNFALGKKMTLEAAIEEKQVT